MITTHYVSYLVRIWQGDDLLNCGWLASLEDPSTKQLTYFQSMEELVAFLGQIADEDQDKEQLIHS